MQCDAMCLEIIEEISISIIVIVGKGTKYRVFRSMFNFF